MLPQKRSMKKPLLALILGLLLSPVAAIEFGVDGLAGNLHFPWTQVTASTAAFATDSYNWGGRAYFGFPLSEDADLFLAYERDPVLRNVGTVSVQFERGIAKISVGPFFGFLNSDAVPFNMGLSTEIRFQWPGVAFASIKSEGAIAIGLLADSLATEPQARAELAAGFYAKNAILSGVVSASRFSMTDANGKALIDALSRYMVQVDLFKKNVGYTLLAEAGYELRSKYYEASALTDTLGSVILGVSTSVMVIPGLTLKGTLESSVFTFGMDNLVGKSPDSSAFLFSAHFGVFVNTSELPKAKLKAAPAP